MLLHEVVSAAAAEAPGRAALVVDDEVTTFAQLDRRVANLAAALAARTEPGDRVAVVADNGPGWVDAYYAVPRAGCLLGFVNQRLGPRPMAAAIERLRPSVLLAGRAQLDALPEPPEVPTVVCLDDADPGRGERPYTDLLAEGTRFAEPEVDPDPERTAWLIATSGTSGSPKVVRLSHRNLLAAVDTTLATRPVAPDDVYLFPFPLCHVAGYNVLAFHRRARPVLVTRRFTAPSFLEQVERHAVTVASLAPTMIHSIVDHLEAGAAAPASLRTVSYGSSGIAPHLLGRAMAALGTGFQQGYGMTELAGNAVFLGAEDHRRGLDEDPHLLETAGRPGPGVEVRLLDDDGHDVPAGSVGEVAVRAAQVAQGYWEAPEADRAAFVDGWFRTGDLGRLDAAGYLTIVDRKKDIIISGGENVSSRAVEDVLSAHPAIAEVAVVGAPDERWGELVCAFVVARPGTELTEDEVLAYGRAEVGGFQQPRRVVLVDALPRNATGKVQKHELRAGLAAPPA